MIPRIPYSIDQSPLYRLTSKRKLLLLLKLPRNRLRNLQSDDLYKVYPLKRHGKTRTIEGPVGELKKVHKRLHNLLSRVQYPEWVFSGVRKRSYIGNAFQHVGIRYALTCDISGFYPSTQAEYVFRFFRYRLKQAENIAWLITDISTFDGHLPTGSPSSPALAFRAYEPMFESIRDLADDSEAEFSLYVDDMAISSEKPLRAGMLKDLEYITHRYGLEIKRNKTRFYGPGQWETITGVAISPGGAPTVPNRLRYKIAKLSKALRKDGLLPKDVRRLHGLLSSARQISPDFCDHLARCVRHIMEASQ